MVENAEGKPLLSVRFKDRSTFVLPKDWEDVFVDYYGPNPRFYLKVAKRLRFVTGKYIEHEAWPHKLDGLGQLLDRGDEEGDILDTDYDEPSFYSELWSEWPEAGIDFGIPRRKITNPPKWADVAEAAMYQSMRGGLLQKALQRLGSKTQVIGPKRFLKEIEDQC